MEKRSTARARRRPPAGSRWIHRAEVDSRCSQGRSRGRRCRQARRPLNERGRISCRCAASARTQGVHSRWPETPTSRPAKPARQAATVEPGSTGRTRPDGRVADVVSRTECAPARSRFATARCRRRWNTGGRAVGDGCVGAARRRGRCSASTEPVVSGIRSASASAGARLGYGTRRWGLDAASSGETQPARPASSGRASIEVAVERLSLARSNPAVAEAVATHRQASKRWKISIAPPSCSVLTRHPRGVQSDQAGLASASAGP